MSRVLIWKNIDPTGEYDIYRQTDNYTQLKSAFNAPGRNFGNRLWFQGLMSEIDTGENEYEFLYEGLTPDVINDSYDFIICPMANIFNRQFVSGIRSFAETLSKIRIPFYVIACGAQAEDYDALESLINDIGEESKRFISAVYNAGGEFALRGHFTKEFFDRLGFPSAVVTGCPSMYQMGREFRISGTEGECQNPVFNGNINMLSDIINKFPKSVHFDQDIFVRALYDPDYISKIDLRSLYVFYRNHGTLAAKLLSEDRIKLIPDMCDWRGYLQKGGFDYSFGTRIHGNIMAILSGIPATVVAIDSRTREMAEFFGIPCVINKDKHPFTKEQFDEFFVQADYKSFNEKYEQNYDAFEAFLVKHNIVSHINQNNAFFEQEMSLFTPPVNREKFSIIHKKLKYSSGLMKMLTLISEVKNKF